MPKPHPDSETESQWMSRCVSEVTGEGVPHDAAVARCLNMWEQATKGESFEGLIVRNKGD